MYVKLSAPASSGKCAVDFETRNDTAFPPVPDHVRIPKIRGSWTLVPTATGQIGISYTVFSDPGGNVPAFLAHGKQREAAVEFLQTILARAEAFAAQERARLPAW
ncbi:MAG: hypothetical protein ACHBMF_11235 [Chromatiales bacterium]